MAVAKRATLADVARQAGVAIGTASKALSGAPHVRQETRDKVLAAAESLQYQPSMAASSLKSGRTYSVGLITSDATGRFTVPVILGAERSLATGRMAILFCDAHDDPVRELHWVQRMLARRVDGFIITSHRSDPRKSLTGMMNVPAVYAFSPSEEDDDVSVVPDDRQGGRLAGEHLLEVGRRRIAYVGGPQSYDASHLRGDGLVDALSAVGLELVTAPLFVEWSENAGRQAARALLRRDADIDGVFCASDQIARGVSEEFQHHGVAVPAEVSIVGFDDWDVMTLATQPALTSVSTNLDRVGEVAATRLTQLIAGVPVTPGIERVPCDIVIRDSSI
ncbi:LacI family DNA-binding transcriptional regulator [Acidipropionibacterium virtanenii]|uniref:Catabolite control protein A n=1 Tax=Acidipropionibacterium virtanenii TaxID=2057246 RepID=A0A344UQW5_9ACTN|nr:LacI family DNA-binding transcriptional regulator [Acidipropionibacterium virtanenii]AXE37663.1 Catabolite control protein A [Acidipropionibacterium virtanenii]